MTRVPPLHALAAFTIAMAGGTSSLPADPTREIVPLALHTVGAGVPIRKVDTKPMLLGRAWPAVVIDGGYLYIIGGLDGGPAALSLVERVDLKTGVSTPYANLLKPRYGHQAFVHGGRLYVVGGLGFSQKRTTVPLAATAPIPPPPAKTEATPAAPAVTSYQTTEGATPLLLTSVESIDLVTGQVSAEPDLPEGRSGFGLVRSGESVLLIAGTAGTRGNPVFTNRILQLDLATRKWSRAGAAPSLGAASFVRVGPGHYIAAGGYDGRQSLDGVYAYSESQRTWKELPSLCQPVSSSAAAHLGDYLFFFGSYEAPEDIVIYNLVTKKSEAFRLGYTPARSAAAIATERFIYIVGGKVSKDAEPNREIQIFELVAKPQAR